MFGRICVPILFKGIERIWVLGGLHLGIGKPDLLLTFLRHSVTGNLDAFLCLVKVGKLF